MIDANKPVTVTLSAGQMNVIMQALYEIAYKHSAPVIDNLRRQILEAESEAFDINAVPRVNGIDAVQG